MTSILAAPLLLLAIIVGYAAVVIGLAVVVHVAGLGAAFGVLVVLFAGCLAWTSRCGR